MRALLLAHSLGLGALAVPLAAAAQASDPARAPVQALSNALIAAMKGGKALGYKGRVSLLQPVVAANFDLPLTTRLIIGPPWTQMSTTDQSAITAAFARFTVAQYARNFSSFGGQSFTVAEKVDARATDRLVRTTLNQPGKAGVPIAYRMRSTGGRWRIVDVYYNNAVSQVATRRADFATILAGKGPKALVAHIDALTVKSAN